MPNTREKLIELLNAVDGVCPKDASCYDCEYKDVVHCSIPAKADYLIANGVTVQKWIPVTERLPEEEGRYLVCNRSRGIDIAVYCINPTPKDLFGEEMVSGFCVPLYNTHGVCIEINEIVTHWMPLPEPPKGE